MEEHLYYFEMEAYVKTQILKKMLMFDCIKFFIVVKFT